MPKRQPQTDPTHETLLLLDRLEELREDMEELGISSLDDLRKRSVDLEARLEDEGGGEHAVEPGDAVQRVGQCPVMACLEDHDDAAVFHRHHLGAGKFGNVRRHRVLRGGSRLHHRRGDVQHRLSHVLFPAQGQGRCWDRS